MQRVVLDTNVIVSGTLTPHGGHPGKILDAWHRGHFTLVSSETIIEEIKRILNKFLDKPEVRKRYTLDSQPIIILLLRRTTAKSGKHKLDKMGVSHHTKVVLLCHYTIITTQRSQGGSVWR